MLAHQFFEKLDIFSLTMVDFFFFYVICSPSKASAETRQKDVKSQGETGLQAKPGRSEFEASRSSFPVLPLLFLLA